MLLYRGKLQENLMMQINCKLRNPYDAVEAVLIDSAYPLRDEHRKEFIAENIKELEHLCRELHKDWKENQEQDKVEIKRPTHSAPATLQ